MQVDVIHHRDDRGDKEYYLYTQAEADKEGIKYTSDWKNAEVGDYIITDGDDEPTVLMILARNKYMTRHVRGTYSLSSGKTIDSRKRINRYSVGGNVPYGSYRTKGEPTSAQIEFARVLETTIGEGHPLGDYSKTYRLLHPNALDATVSTNASAIKKSSSAYRALLQVMDERGLTETLAIDSIKETLEAKITKKPTHSEKTQAATLYFKLSGDLGKEGESDSKPKFLSFSEEELDLLEQKHTKRTVTISQ